MSEAIYTRQPRTVRALQWTGDNFADITEFVGIPRRAACNLNSGVAFVYCAERVMRVLLGDWLYFDDRRELFAMSDLRFQEEFNTTSAVPVVKYPPLEVMHHPV